MIKIFISGDVVPIRRSLSLFKHKDSSLFDSIKSFIANTDISIVNFEAPIVQKEIFGISKYGPCLKTGEYTLELLKEVGFNTITLANNHFRDYGQQGVEDSIQCAKQLSIDYVGGGITLKDARKYLIKEIEGKRVAIINACEHEYSVATEEYGGSNGLDIISMDEDIVAARNEADYVILILHGGIEHYQLPTPRMKRWYRHFIDMGADAVVNHHQHCFSGYEIYKEKPIFYGLGNFCFDSFKKQPVSPWNYGYAIVLKLNYNINFDLIPYKQCAERPCIELCEYYEFEKELKVLNEIIADDKLLNIAFQKHIFSRKIELLGSLLPFGRYFMALYRRGILGSLYNRRNLLKVKNYIECESHYEALSTLVKLLSK